MKKKILVFTAVLLLSGLLLFSGCTRTDNGNVTTIVYTCDSRATQLTPDEQIEDSIYVNGLFKMYSIYVPSGTSSLTVMLLDLEQDLDLYIGYGTYESLDNEEYDWISNNVGTTSENITLNNPQEGCYYIQVVDYENTGGSFELHAYLD